MFLYPLNGRKQLGGYSDQMPLCLHSLPVCFSSGKQHYCTKPKMFNVSPATDRPVCFSLMIEIHLYLNDTYIYILNTGSIVLFFAKKKKNYSY